jgi:hypothetical protein
MELILPVINLLTEVGKLVNFHNSNAVLDRIAELKTLYEEEMAKGTLRDDALVFSIRLELCNICNIYCATVKGQTTKG